MATRHTLNLVDGKVEADRDILMYQTANSFEMGACEPGELSLLPCPLPTMTPVCTIWLSGLADDLL